MNGEDKLKTLNWKEALLAQVLRGGPWAIAAVVLAFFLNQYTLKPMEQDRVHREEDRRALVTVLTSNVEFTQAALDSIANSTEVIADAVRRQEESMKTFVSEMRLFTMEMGVTHPVMQNKLDDLLKEHEALRHEAENGSGGG